MLEYSFSVRHEGCWTADMNNEFPRVDATILQSHAFSDSSSTVIEVPGIDDGCAESLADWMGDHEVVRTVDLVRHTGDTGLISFHTDYSDSDTQPVGNVFREQPCIPLASAEVRNGQEHCQVMMTDREQVQTVYEELCEYGPVEIQSLNELDTDFHVSDLAAVSRAIAGLSTRQQQILERAITHGYYDVPQSCTVEDLAAEDSVTMSTVAEHLRHAEFKIFDAIEPLLTNDSESS
jgi:predicted DNA binding protein